MKRNIDELLESAREPEPRDEGFSERVMSAIRRPEIRSSNAVSWRRHVTRPALVAAIITLLSSAAFAAIRTADPDASRSEQPGPAPRPEARVEVTPSLPVELPIAGPTPSRRPESPRPSPSERSENWGYSNSHTAYTIDRGLRLETDTGTNNFATGSGQRVRMTLENISSERIAVSGPRGCTLGVTAFRDRREQTRDSSAVSACATVEPQSPSSSDRGDSEVIVLEPGRKVSGIAVLTLPDDGQWAVIGRCVCSGRDGGTPPPKPQRSPSEPVPPVLGSPSPRPTEQPPSRDYWGWRMMTPPIRVEASSG